MPPNDKTPIYKIIRIPKRSPRLADLVTKSRSARLHALETDPTSFLSLHATESALPLHVWEKRLCDPEITVLACVVVYPTISATHTSTNINTNANGSDSTEYLDDETALLSGDWVGFAAVRGPMSEEEYYTTPDMGLPVPERPEEENRWHVFDLYTLPAHRGRGLARRMVGECVAVAVEGISRTAASDEDGADVRGIEKARIRLFMNPKNPWLVKMYEGLGFEVVGKVTLEEGFRANKLDDSIPADTGGSEELERMWHTRFGLAMERVVGIGRG